MIAVLFTCSFLLLSVQGMANADSSKEISYTENNASKIFENPKVFIVRLKIIRIVLSMSLFMTLKIIYENSSI